MRDTINGVIEFLDDLGCAIHQHNVDGELVHVHYGVRGVNGKCLHLWFRHDVMVVLDNPNTDHTSNWDVDGYNSVDLSYDNPEFFTILEKLARLECHMIVRKL